MKQDFSGSLFSFLEARCSIRISCADSELSVPDRGVARDAKAFSVLGARIGLLLMKQLHYDNENMPVLYSRDYLRSDIFKFHIRRRRRD